MITILAGLSASGKDKTLNKLINLGYSPIIPTTTRPMRPNEVDGVDYHFVSREEFFNLIEEDKLIEYREYHTLVNNIPDTWYYGVEKFEVEDKNYVIVLPLDSARRFKKLYNCIVYYLYASYEIRKERAMKRGGFDEIEFERREVADIEEFESGYGCEVVDFFIENIEIDNVVNMIDGLNKRGWCGYERV